MAPYIVPLYSLMLDYHSLFKSVLKIQLKAFLGTLKIVKFRKKSLQIFSDLEKSKIVHISHECY